MIYQQLHDIALFGGRVTFHRQTQAEQFQGAGAFLDHGNTSEALDLSNLLPPHQRFQLNPVHIRRARPGKGITWRLGRFASHLP